MTEKSDFKVRIDQKTKNVIKLISVYEDTTMQKQLEKAIHLYISYYRNKIPELFVEGNVIVNNKIVKQ